MGFKSKESMLIVSTIGPHGAEIGEVLVREDGGSSEDRVQLQRPTAELRKPGQSVRGRLLLSHAEPRSYFVSVPGRAKWDCTKKIGWVGSI